MTDIKYLEKYLQKDKLDEGINRLNNGEPVQYIIGNVNFYGNTIKVDKRVLIPRFETEELVDRTIKYLVNHFSNKNLDIIDLGTGSGCIAITLKKILSCNIDAIDISNDALEVARDNAKTNNVEINFILNDMLTGINKKYDCIISNPPYISYEEEIMDVVKNNEPNVALYASNEGLYFYEEILKNCSKNLKDKYLIAFEIGYKQGDKIKALALKYLPTCEVKIEQDLQGKDRFLFIMTGE